MKTIGHRSRGSKLALWQAKWIKALFALHRSERGNRIIKTRRCKDGVVSVIAEKCFTKERQSPSQPYRLAVHSLKDTKQPSRPALAVQLRAEDTRDALGKGRNTQGSSDGFAFRRGCRQTTLGIAQWNFAPDMSQRMRGKSTPDCGNSTRKYEALLLARRRVRRLG